MIRTAFSLFLAAAVAAPALALPREGEPGYVRSSPDLGKAEAQCRANEAGPAVLVDITGLKDRTGMLRVEIYPPTDEDFLAPDNRLVMGGKLFRRVEQAVPAGAEPIRMCIRVPGPGVYTLSVLHDRDSNHKYGLSIDGVGVANNPRICFGKPSAEAASLRAGPGITVLPITMQYRRNLFCLGPHKANR